MYLYHFFVHKAPWAHRECTRVIDPRKLMPRGLGLGLGLGYGYGYGHP